VSESSILSPQYAQHRALIALIVVIVIPVLCAGWLNGFRLFAFPFGTFLTALIVPLALVVVAFAVPRAAEEELEEL